MTEEQGLLRISGDRIAAELGGEPVPEGYVAFTGYLRPGDADGTQQIVVDDQFLRWLVVKTEDVAAVLDAPADSKDRRGLIYVRRGARVTRCETAFAPEVANEGFGVGTPRLESAEGFRGPPPPY